MKTTILTILILENQREKKKNVHLVSSPPPKLFDKFTYAHLVKRLASSIHTIHRPLARSQRLPIPTASNETHAAVPADLPDISSEEEIENDFEEETTPTSAIETMRGSSKIAEHRPIPPPHERAGSMATIRLHRRARLADKLREVFELDDISEVLAGALSTMKLLILFGSRLLTHICDYRDAVVAITLCL